MKNETESTNSSMDKEEETICDLEDRNFESIQSGENKEKRMKRVKVAYLIYGIASRETICELLESQKEKKGIRGQKVYLKK